MEREAPALVSASLPPPPTSHLRSHFSTTENGRIDSMAMTPEQKAEIEGILQLLLDSTASAPRGRRRRLADMFLNLVNKNDWAEYYEVGGNARLT